MKQLVTIDLFGQTYTFEADSEVAEAKEVADFVVKEVARVEAQQLGRPSNSVILILVALLNIANENIEMKRKHSDLLRNISERSVNLMRAIDTVMQ